MSYSPLYEPTQSYTAHCIEGWPVLVSSGLAQENGLCEQVLNLLEVKLYDVGRAIPETALGELRKTRFWLEREGDVTCACYHPSKQWLSEHGFNPDKTRSVEIGNAINFLNWTHHQPEMVLHELAHAYHHGVLGYEHSGIKAAYQSAVQEGSYQAVLRYDGTTARAYALNNEQEYFAELTESYFGTNDFYPFVRAELMLHDPRMFDLLRELWEHSD